MMAIPCTASPSVIGKSSNILLSLSAHACTARAYGSCPICVHVCSWTICSTASFLMKVKSLFGNIVSQILICEFIKLSF